jgi:acyl carrier protein
MNDTKGEIRNHMAEVLGVAVDRIDDDARLDELVHSSFLLVEMIIDLQEEFEVRFGQAEMEGVKTVGQLIELFSRIRAKGSQPERAESVS